MEVVIGRGMVEEVEVDLPRANGSVGESPRRVCAGTGDGRVGIFWKSWQRRKTGGSDWGVWAAGLAATFINPYGGRIWAEVWRQTYDPLARSFIVEWLPFYADFELGFAFLTVLTGGLVYLFRKDIPWWKMATVAAFWVAGLGSLRHIALFAIAAAALDAEMLKRLYEKVAKSQESKTQLKIGVKRHWDGYGD